MLWPGKEAGIHKEVVEIRQKYNQRETFDMVTALRQVH